MKAVDHLNEFYVEHKAFPAREQLDGTNIGNIVRNGIYGFTINQFQ